MTVDSPRGRARRPRPALAEALDLQPHPEGGWFRETWRSPVSLCPAGYDGPRRAATAIYYLLCPGEESAWHLVRSDELWLWHSGGPLPLRLGGTGEVPPDRGGEEITLGCDFAGGARAQVLVSGGTWQAATPAGDQPALVSCVVVPGFDYADFRLATPAQPPR